MLISRESEKKDILEYLKERSAVLGHTVLKSEATKEERKIIAYMFGSWSNAVKESGLEDSNSPAQMSLRISQLKESKKTKTKVLRLVPGYERKAVQIASARKCVGKAGDTDDKKEKINNGLTVLSALTGWALEGAIITADSMRSRGYGTARRTSFSIYRFELRDKLFLLAMLLLIAAVILAAAGGATAASYIPGVNVTAIDNAGSVIGIAAYICFMAIPTLLNVTEAITWKYLRNNKIAS